MLLLLCTTHIVTLVIITHSYYTLIIMHIGIFATHLHELFKLPLRLKHVTNKRMGVTLDPATNGKIVSFYCV